MEKTQELSCDTYFFQRKPPKCRYSWFKAYKVYVYDEECPGAWEKGRRIGEKSSFGTAHRACCDKSCGYVMKEVKYTKGFTEKMFVNEVKIQEDVYEKSKLAPKVYDMILGTDRGVVVMEAMQFTLKRYIKNKIKDMEEYSKKWEDLFRRTIPRIIVTLEVLHYHGFYHGDTHADNFMTGNNARSWLMIDFDSAGRLPDDKGKALELRRRDFIQIYTNIIMEFDYQSPLLKAKIESLG